MEPGPAGQLLAARYYSLMARLKELDPGNQELRTLTTPNYTPTAEAVARVARAYDEANRTISPAALLGNAAQPYNQFLTQAGRALTKHTEVAGIEGLFKSVASFEFSGFIAACRLPDFSAHGISRSDTTVSDFVQHIRLVLVSAYDQEGLVISEIRPKVGS